MRHALAIGMVCLAAACTGGAENDARVAADGIAAVALARIDQPSYPQAFPPTGRTVVINLWASWCEPCRREMPALDALSSLADAASLQVIGVNVDDDRNLALEYLRAYPVSFDQYWDPGMRATAAAWRLAGVPATLIVGPDGRMRARLIGPRDWNSEPMRRLIFSVSQPQA